LDDRGDLLLDLGGCFFEFGRDLYVAQVGRHRLSFQPATRSSVRRTATRNGLWSGW
jgi:hypothetical protein